MENLQDKKLSAERRNQILDLIISDLNRDEGICNSVGRTIAKCYLTKDRWSLIKLEEIEQIRNELNLLFKKRLKEGYTYNITDNPPFKFVKSRKGLFCFETYKERIDFLTNLKTTNDIRTGN